MLPFAVCVSLFSAPSSLGRQKQKAEWGQDEVTAKFCTQDQHEVSASPPYYCTITSTPSFTICQGFPFLVPVDFRFSNSSFWSVTPARFWINWPVVGCPFSFRSACCKNETAGGRGRVSTESGWPTYIFARVLQGSIQGDLPTTGAHNYTQQATLLKVVHVYQHSSKCTDKQVLLQSTRVCVLVSALEQAGRGGWLNVSGCVGCKQCVRISRCAFTGAGSFLFFFSCSSHSQR